MYIVVISLSLAFSTTSSIVFNHRRADGVMDEVLVQQFDSPTSRGSQLTAHGHC